MAPCLRLYMQGGVAICVDELASAGECAAVLSGFAEKLPKGGMSMQRKYIAAASAAAGVAIAAGAATLSGVSRGSGLPPVTWPNPFSGIQRLQARYVLELQEERDQLDLARSISTGDTANYFLCGSVFGS